jgi:hypothetical protein
MRNFLLDCGIVAAVMEEVKKTRLTKDSLSAAVSAYCALALKISDPSVRRR